VERSGAPVALDDLEAHALVWFVDALNDLPELQFLHLLVPEAALAFQCTTVGGQQAAVAAGLGIGLLPRFSAEADPRLVRVLDGEVEIRRTFWLIVPEESARVARVREVAGFLRASARAQQQRFLTGVPSSPGPAVLG
jgi:DNA-binding transcriptional LysR family regulator